MSEQTDIISQYSINRLLLLLFFELRRIVLTALYETNVFI